MREPYNPHHLGRISYGWICTIQILQNVSQRQVYDLDYLDRDLYDVRKYRHTATPPGLSFLLVAARQWW